jgi:hypothetical protein
MVKLGLPSGPDQKLVRHHPIATIGIRYSVIANNMFLRNVSLQVYKSTRRHKHRQLQKTTHIKPVLLSPVT